MLTLSLFIFILIGCCAGFFGGLFGIGGGIIVVPALLATFHLIGFAPAHVMQVAAGTSLASMILTSTSSAWGHYKKNGVNWTVLKALVPGMMLGAFLGGLLAHLFPSQQLYFSFSIFLCGVGIYFLLPAKIQEPEKIFSPSPITISLLGTGIGTLSSLFGIGGGFITVPTLTAIGLPLKNAISTSAFTGFIVSIFGTLTFTYVGLHHEHSPGTLGYLYLPAFICIGVSSALVAPLGVKCAYILPDHTLKQILGIFILIVGIAMIITHY